MGGCDGAGSKRASLYERLTGTGTWSIERLEGDIDYTAQLNERYPAGVTITFAGGEGGQTYQVVSLRSDDSTEVVAEGVVTLPGDDRLRMASGFSRQVAWRYRFQTTSRAIFEVQYGSQAFMSALLSGGGRSPDLKMELAPADE